jgi:hypothetical protein
MGSISAPYSSCSLNELQPPENILRSASDRRPKRRPLHHAWLRVEASHYVLPTEPLPKEERERELAGEFNRWYDLVRLGADYFVNHVRLYNPHALSVAEKYALRPIPMFR